MVHRGVEWVAKFMCVGLLLFQGILINTYLSMLYSSAWWSWITADIIVIAVWTFSLVMVWKSFLKKKPEDFVDGRDPTQSPHELKYTFIAWISYVVFLCPRIVLLFHNLTKTLDEEDVLGPNFLKIAVSCTPLIFLLLVYGSHNSKSLSQRHMSVNVIAAAGALDLFDSIDLLDFLFIPETELTFPVAYSHATLIFCCISFFLPALSLYGLRFSTISGRVSPLSFKILNMFLITVLINIPNLVIRSILWHKYNADVSVLLMKNVMGIFVGFYEVFEYFGEYRPKVCKKCKDSFERATYGNHKEVCGRMESDLLEYVDDSMHE